MHYFSRFQLATLKQRKKANEWVISVEKPVLWGAKKPHMTNQTERWFPSPKWKYNYANGRPGKKCCRPLVINQKSLRFPSFFRHFITHQTYYCIPIEFHTFKAKFSKKVFFFFCFFCYYTLVPKDQNWVRFHFSINAQKIVGR